MQKFGPQIGDADFWWKKYFCGLALPLFLTLGAIYSIISRHSYTVWINIGVYGKPWISVEPVADEQAILMGVAYLGMAIALFANCYAQYHDKMGFYYQWLLLPGVLLAGSGYLLCSLSLFHF